MALLFVRGYCISIHIGSVLNQVSDMGTDGSVGINPTLLAMARLRALRADSDRPSEPNSSLVGGKPLAVISAKSSLGVGKVDWIISVE